MISNSCHETQITRLGFVDFRYKNAKSSKLEKGTSKSFKIKGSAYHFIHLELLLVGGQILCLAPQQSEIPQNYSPENSSGRSL